MEHLCGCHLQIKGGDRAKRPEKRHLCNVEFSGLQLEREQIVMLGPSSNYRRPFSKSKQDVAIPTGG